MLKKRCDCPSGLQRPASGRLLGIGGSVLVIGAIVLTSEANAQTKIEQMIVTAQKRSQDIQTVPASISAFSSEGLSARQINTIENVLQATPNVVWSVGPGSTPTLSVRGVSTDGTNGAIDPSIALHVDGVYQPRISNVLLAMNDLESVEVLRGPQGTVYGRNANAGVINFNSARPTEDFEAGGSIFGGSYKRHGFKAYVSGPVVDKVSVRLSGIVDRRSGWGRNLFNGTRPEADRFYGVRASIRIRPVETVTVDFIASRSFDHNTNDRYTFEGMSGANYNAIAALGGQFTKQPWRTYAEYAPEQTHFQQMATGIVTWEATPDVTVKSISSIIHSVDDVRVDVDTTSFAYFGTTQRMAATTFSQEFNVNAKIFGVDTVTGFYHLKDHSNGGTLVPYFNGFPTPSLAPGTLRDRVVNAINDTYAKSTAVFFDATVPISDDIRFLAGIRRTWDEKVVYQTQGVTGVGLTYSCFHRRYPDLEYASTTGKVGLQYDLTPEVMLYVQWQNGFKTGGYNSSVCGNSFAPEKISAWEGGIKGRYFSDTVSLNMSVFSYDYKNLQLSRVVGPATTRVDNAAVADIKGAELEAMVNFTDELSMDLSIGYLDSEYVNYAASQFTGGPIIDVSGNQLTKAPKLTLNLGLQYIFRLADLGDLKVRGEWYRSSRIYYTPFNEIAAKQDAYNVLNAFMTFTPDDSPYQFQVFGRNLGDKAYKAGASFSTGLNYAYGVWAPPRTFGAEISAKF